MKKFDTIERFCMFVGYPQSGHSLVGSMLDAHPEIVIAHEADALKMLSDGCSRDELFESLLGSSKQFTEKGRKWTGYSYAIPSQWNGRFSSLKVIGDKKGAGSTDQISKQPDLVGKLRRLVRVPVRVVHVTRNPFDIISTWNTRVGRPISHGIKLLIQRAKGVAQARELFTSDEWIDVVHEDLVRDPENNLARLVKFLSRDVPAGYLEDCTGIVFKRPNLSRFNVKWDSESKTRLLDGLAGYPWLAGYRFEE